MRDVEFDQLTDELIDAKASIADLESRLFAARDDYAGLEISWHQLRDEYSELARALGVPGDGFWGDPLVSHADVMARANELSNFARAA